MLNATLRAARQGAKAYSDAERMRLIQQRERVYEQPARGCNGDLFPFPRRDERRN